MKNFLTSLLFVSVTFEFIYGFQRFDRQTIELVEKYNNAVMKCKNEFNASNETMKNMFRMETQDDKCFTGCVMEHTGMIKGSDSNWEFQKTNMTRLFAPHATKCEGKVNADKCELAYELASCFQQEGLKLQIRKDFREETTKAGIKCKENYNLTDDVIMDILRRDNLGPRENKCFMGCVLEALGIINGATYDWESHIKILMNSTPTLLDNIIINNCKGKVNEDRCELAYEIMSCIRAEAKKIVDGDNSVGLRDALATCEENPHMSREALKTLLMKGKLETRDEKCHAGCVLEGMGYIKGNTFDWDNYAKLNPSYAESSKTCEAIVNEDKCELADEVITCLKTNN